MATKAEQVKAENQRAAQAQKPKKVSRKVTKSYRSKDRYPNPTSHNESPTEAKNSVYELEPGLSTRPSRKSTRRSPTHVKTDSALRITTVARNTSPQARFVQRGTARSGARKGPPSTGRR
jgi:hypothetical protein